MFRNVKDIRGAKSPLDAEQRRDCRLICCIVWQMLSPSGTEADIKRRMILFLSLISDGEN